MFIPHRGYEGNYKQTVVPKFNRRYIFIRTITYYEWSKPGYNNLEDKNNQDRVIPLEYHSPEGRYHTPMWDRVFPDGVDLVEIDDERYILLLRNWAIRRNELLMKFREALL